MRIPNSTPLLLGIILLSYLHSAQVRAQESFYQISIARGSTYSLSDFTYPSVDTYEFNDFTCNIQTPPGRPGSVNPRYIVIDDPAHAGFKCYKDITAYIEPLSLGNYSIALKFGIKQPDYRPDHKIDIDYSNYTETLPFIKQNCDPSSGCSVCNYNTIGYIESLSPNTPPGNFIIGVTGGIIINVATSAEEITFPGFNRPVTVGDIWKSSYCIQ